MGNSPSFVQHCLDLLVPLGPVTARSMFGGHGLYADGLMFGLLDDGDLFLKTDAECEARFVAGGGKAWVYPSRNGPMVTSYFQPPAAAMEEAEAMRPWFELALAVARRKAAAKGVKKPRAKTAEAGQAGKRAKAAKPSAAAAPSKSAKRNAKAAPAKKATAAKPAKRRGRQPGAKPARAARPLKRKR